MSGVLYGGLRTAATDRLRDLIARRRTRKLVAALPAAAIPKGCTARSLSAQNGVSVLVVDTEPELSPAGGRRRRGPGDHPAPPACPGRAAPGPSLRAARPRAPRVVEGDPGGSWLVESVALGEPEEALSDRGGAAAPAAALDALSLLHDSTDESRTVGEPDLHALDRCARPGSCARSWVAVGATRGSTRSSRTCGARSSNRAVTIVRIHGDATPGNFLFTSDGEHVAGIIDWEASRRGLPEVDIAHYLISERCWKSHVQLGEVVVDVLRHGWSPGERELLDAHSREPTRSSTETIVLLVWLLHVANNLRKAGRYARHLLWIRSNINRVLAAVDREALLPGRVPSAAFTRMGAQSGAQSGEGGDREALVVDLTMHAAEVWRLLVRETESQRWLDAFLFSAAANQILEDALTSPAEHQRTRGGVSRPSRRPLSRAAGRAAGALNRAFDRGRTRSPAGRLLVAHRDELKRLTTDLAVVAPRPTGPIPQSARELQLGARRSA